MDLLDDLLAASDERDDLASDGGIKKSDVDENWEITVCRGYNENSVRLVEGEIKLYPQAMGLDVTAKFQNLVQEVKEKEGVVERLDIEKEVAKLEDMDKSEIDNLLNIYEGVILDRHAELLRSSLYLQRAAAHDEISLDKPIDSYKNDLKQDFGTIAYYMNHLVSSGYFNRDEFFHNMYLELMEREGNTDQRYRDEFELIVEKELIAYYVSSDDTPRKAMLGTRRLLSGYFRYNPYCDFIDVRGLGSDCEDIVEKAIELLEETEGDVLYKELESDKEMAIRILPNSMEYLS